MQDITKSVALPGVVQLLKESWAAFIKRIGTFVLLVIIPIFASGLIIGPLVVLAIVAFIFLAPESFPIDASVLLYVVLGFLGLFAIFAIVVIQAWVGAALIFAVADEKLSLKDALRKGWKQLLSYLWISFLFNIIIGIGFLLFFIPGIIFAVWFSLTLFVFAVEGVKGSQALHKSRAYVRGRFWKVFGRLIAVFVIGYVVSFVPAALDEMLDFSIFSLLFLPISFLMGPFILIYVHRLYRHIVRVSGKDSSSAMESSS